MLALVAILVVVGRAHATPHDGHESLADQLGAAIQETRAAINTKTAAMSSGQANAWKRASTGFAILGKSLKLAGFNLAALVARVPVTHDRRVYPGAPPSKGPFVPPVIMGGKTRRTKRSGPSCSFRAPK